LDPNEIRRLIAHAKVLLVNNQTTPEAFILLYIAWEGLVRRILRVHLAARGMNKEEANLALANARLSSSFGTREAFIEILGSNLNQIKGVGHLFRNLKMLNDLRHRYVHGRSRTSPKIFRTASETLIQILEADWATVNLNVLKGSGLKYKSIDPYKRIFVSQ
jgi:hypothetical protein